MKKFLAGLLCFVMILCMMPAVEVNAEDGNDNTQTENIGDTGDITDINILRDKLGSVATITENGDEISIELTCNIIGRICFEMPGKTILFDANGKTIDGGTYNEAICLQNLGQNNVEPFTLVLFGDGTYNEGCHNVIYVGTSSNLIIKSATINGNLYGSWGTVTTMLDSENGYDYYRIFKNETPVKVLDSDEINHTEAYVFSNYDGTLVVKQYEACVQHNYGDDNKCTVCGEKKPIVLPMITTQPQDSSIKVGETATFTVTASGENLAYQWQIDRNDGNGFVNIINATSASYTTSTVDENCNGYKYQCVVTNTTGSVTSNTATLTVETNGHNHAVCGEVGCTKDHNNDDVVESHANVDWQAWDGSDMDANTKGIQLTAGNWYLAENMNPADTINIVGEVNLCLNGMVLSGATHSEPIIVVQEGAILNLCDCKNTEHKFTPDRDGRWVLDEVSGTKTVNGGVITGAVEDSSAGISCVGTMNVYGGNIVGNAAWWYGTIYSTGIFNMYDGIVCGNTGASAVNIDYDGLGNLYRGQIFENKILNAAVYVDGTLGISGDIEIYRNTDDFGNNKNLLNRNKFHSIIIMGPLHNTKKIGVSYDVTNYFAEADGMKVSDLTEYLDHFECDDSSKQLLLTTDKKCIVICGNTETLPVIDITAHPANISVKAGESATFKVTASGENLEYQWQIDKNDGNGFVDIQYARSASYTISNVDTDSTGFKYQCVIKSSFNRATTNAATLTVEQKTSVETPPANNPSGGGNAPEQQPTYSILEGADSDWTQGSEKEVTVRADGDFAKFSGVKVNDTVIDAKYYTAVSGSTIVTLKQEYLDTLTEGTYKMTIVYTDGECSTNFQIKKAVEDNPVENKPESGENKEDTQQNTTTTSPAAKEEVDSPKTGDNATFYVAMLFLVGSAVIGTSVVRRKQTR